MLCPNGGDVVHVTPVFACICAVFIFERLVFAVKIEVWLQQRVYALQCSVFLFDEVSQEARASALTPRQSPARMEIKMFLRFIILLPKRCWIYDAQFLFVCKGKDFFRVAKHEHVIAFFKGVHCIKVR